MQSGPLDRRVRFERSASVPGEYGTDVKDWALQFETWCEKARLTGAEVVAALESVDEQTVKLRIHWRPDLEAGADRRFIFEGKTWRIHAVEEIGRKEGLFITGKTRADGGQVPT